MSPLPTGLDYFAAWVLTVSSAAGDGHTDKQTHIRYGAPGQEGRTERVRRHGIPGVVY
jgi:hypothetical protein